MRFKPSHALALLLLTSLFLYAPHTVDATAIATSSIAFNNLEVSPASGTLVFIQDFDVDGEPDPWTLQAFAQAQNSLGESAQIFHEILGPGSLTVTATVTWATGIGGPVTDPLPLLPPLM
jgi:hypothetical protein